MIINVWFGMASQGNRPEGVVWLPRVIALRGLYAYSV